MSCEDDASINTLWIDIGVSEDEDNHDNDCDVKDGDHYHITKFSHARAEIVNIQIAGWCDDEKLDFEYDGSVDDDWSCNFDMLPNYSNKSAQRTKDSFKTALLFHDSAGDPECLNTEIQHKNDSGNDWQQFITDFDVRLR